MTCSSVWHKVLPLARAAVASQGTSKVIVVKPAFLTESGRLYVRFNPLTCFPLVPMGMGVWLAQVWQRFREV